MHRPGRHAGDPRRDVCSPRACPAANRPWGRHNRIPAPSRGVTLPRRPDYRRAVTRVKDACGAARGGRAISPVLDPGLPLAGLGSSAGKGHGVSSLCPANGIASAKLQAETPLDISPLLQGCTFTRHLSPVLVVLRSQSRLRLEGRTRTLSGPSPDLSPAGVLAPFVLCDLVREPGARVFTCGFIEAMPCRAATGACAGPTQMVWRWCGEIPTCAASLL